MLYFFNHTVKIEHFLRISGSPGKPSDARCRRLYLREAGDIHPDTGSFPEIFLAPEAAKKTNMSYRKISGNATGIRPIGANPEAEIDREPEIAPALELRNKKRLFFTISACHNPIKCYIIVEYIL